MEKRFVYADNAATTPMSETAFNAMKPWLTEHYGNPSSLYRMGRAAKEALNEARTVVGKCLNAAEPVNEKNDYAPGEIVFTGGGTVRPPRAASISSPPRSSTTPCSIPVRHWRKRATALPI